MCECGRRRRSGGAIAGHGFLCCLQPLCCPEWWHMGSVGFVLIAECKSAPSVPRRDVRGLSPLSRYPWSGPHIAEPSYDSGKICTAVWQCLLSLLIRIYDCPKPLKNIESMLNTPFGAVTNILCSSSTQPSLHVEIPCYEVTVSIVALLLE